MVGSGGGWFTWLPSPLVIGGHVVKFYMSSATLTGVAATTLQLTMTFASTPTHLPTSPLAICVLVDTNTIGRGVFQAGSFVVTFVPGLTGGSHILESFATNYVSTT